MITLSDISVFNLINYYKDRAEFELLSEEIYKWCLDNNIKNYLDIKKLLDDNNTSLSPIAIQTLTKQLKKVIHRIEKANKLGKEAPVFNFDNYSYLGIDAETLRITDTSNKGGILLYDSPISNTGHIIANRLNNFTITEIKYLLSHITDDELKNGLTIITNLYRSECPRIAKIVDFYDQQVLRQAFETEKRGIDLFALNREEKRRIVEKNIKDIVEFIADNAGDECIWGSFKNYPKERVKSITRSNYYFGNSQISRENLIDIFTDYTTLTELKNDICTEQEIIVVENKVKTLKKVIPANRFIFKQ